LTVFTHFAAGALIGHFSPGIISASLYGLVSHAALDVIPHYDIQVIFVIGVITYLIWSV